MPECPRYNVKSVASREVYYLLPGHQTKKLLWKSLMDCARVALHEYDHMLAKTFDACQ